MVEPASRAGFRWWTPRGNEVQIRRLEIQARVGWGVGIRWLFVVAGVLVVALGVLGLLPLRLDLSLISLATGLLAVCNSIFSVLASRVGRSWLSPKSFLVVQALADFSALTVLSYAFGTAETPITILYLPHVVLLTLLLEWRASLAMTLVAAGLAVLPLFLMHWGLLPVISVFGSDLPARLAAIPTLAWGFVLGVFVCFTTCWYLVSQVSNGLVLREKRLEQECDRLTRVSNTKTLATLRATHELKAPLAAIKSYVYTMRDGFTGELPDKARQVIDRIGERCDLLTERITDIIHLSNLETLSREEVVLAEHDLYDVLVAEVADAAQRGQPRSVRIGLDARPAGSTLIAASAGELRSMLVNLLDNAVEYSHPRGEVLVTMASDRAGVHVRIADRGIGIPADNVPRIFDNHFRSNNAVAHKANGSGLGMSIVREIARLHHAEVAITSELGAGTEVSLVFPHAQPLIGADNGSYPAD